MLPMGKHSAAHALNRAYTSTPDLSGFDKFARKTAKDCLAAGWVGRLSNNGHLILRAPDGGGTVALCKTTVGARHRQNTLSQIRRAQRPGRRASGM